LFTEQTDVTMGELAATLGGASAGAISGALKTLTEPRRLNGQGVTLTLRLAAPTSPPSIGAAVAVRRMVHRAGCGPN
jgi:hypothetical protein